MKILARIFIGLCLIFNFFIGYFIYWSSLPVSHYPYYGFDISIPDRFIFIEDGDPTISLVDSYYQYQYGDKSHRTLQVYAYEDSSEIVRTGDEYKSISKIDQEKNKGFTYQDGGVFSNQNGVKMYYDVILIDTGDGAGQIEKHVTFFQNDRAIVLIWIDDPNDFASTVTQFDEIVQSVKFQ